MLPEIYPEVLNLSESLLAGNIVHATWIRSVHIPVLVWQSAGTATFSDRAVTWLLWL